MLQHSDSHRIGLSDEPSRRRYFLRRSREDKSARTHLVRTLSGDGGLLDSRLSIACHSLRHDRSLSIRCS